MEHPLFKKLGLRAQDPILILNAPDEFNPFVEQLTTAIHIEPQTNYDFILAFATSLAQGSELAAQTVPLLNHDGHLWLAYPKGSSKKYPKVDINRNKTWDLFTAHEFRPVTQIAIDEDWSALRFRHHSLVKSSK